MPATYTYTRMDCFFRVRCHKDREGGTSNTASAMISVDVVLSLYFTTYVTIITLSWQQADNETTQPP